MTKRISKATGRRVPKGLNQAPTPKAAGHAPVKGQTLREEVEQLRAQLAEAEETLRAIREGEVDAIVVSGSEGERVFSLTGAEQVYRLIVETMREAAVTLAFDGTILFANAQFGQFVKRPMKRIRGHSLTEFVAPDHRATVAALLSTNPAQPVKTRLVLQDSDGMCIPAHVSSSILDQPDGTSICIVATNLTDLENSTELVRQLRRQQEALRSSERLYRAIGESIDYGVWVCDAEGRNTYASESFLKLVGMTQEQCSSFGWGSVLHPADAERTMAAWKECVRTGGTWDIEHRFRGVDGQWHPVLARGMPVRNERGEITYWAGINLDISSLKRAEEALQEADRHKDDFLALLGHELRNPLSPIAHAVDLLRSLGPADERQRRAHDMIDRQLTHLVHLVDDLLDISRISHGKILLRREIFDLVAMVDAVVEDHRPLLESNGLRLHLALPPALLLVEGDRVRIAQVVANLLTNAGKFTPAGGHVSVELNAGPDSEAHITVSDTGIGIEAELLSCIFRPFTQGAHRPEVARGGLGLGLALVQALTELHGGTVCVNSAGPGKGAQFIVTLPTQLQRPVSPEEPTPVPKAAATSPRRVLVIEDERMAAEGLQMLLELDGHTVTTASTGREGIEKAKALQPELVISDIDLGDGMDGRAVARALRQEPEVARAYMVAYSGFGQEHDKRKSLDAGFDVHLTKPIRVDDLRRVVAQLPSPPNTEVRHE